MALGYFRQSTSSIVPGGVVKSGIFNAEFNAIEAAFNQTSGHNHDGTAGGGAKIPARGLDGVTQTGFIANRDDVLLQGRTITAGSNIQVTNGDGVSGNPVIAVVGTLEDFASQGITDRATDEQLDLTDELITFRTQVEYRSAIPIWDFYQTDQDTNLKRWRFHGGVSDGSLAILTANDTGDVTNSEVLRAYRGADGRSTAVTLLDRGAGPRVTIADASMTIETPLTVKGAITAEGGINATVTGNSATATKLATARTITLTGAVTGSVSFDGSANVSMSTTNSDPFVGGMIMMWWGNINAPPTNWRVCNGTNGTPDLRNRFIVGAGSGYAVGDLGGTDTKNTTSVADHAHAGTSDFAGAHSHGGATAGHALSIGEIPSHSHRIIYGGQPGGATGFVLANNVIGPQFDTSYIEASGGSGAHAHGIAADGSHVHTFTTGAAGAHNHQVDVRPPYVAVAFIMHV